MINVIINKSIFSYALFINFHNHFIFHLVRGSFWLQYYDFPSQQFICDIIKYFIENLNRIVLVSAILE